MNCTTLSGMFLTNQILGYFHVYMLVREVHLLPNNVDLKTGTAVLPDSNLAPKNTLKPWLMELASSPVSLSANNGQDKAESQETYRRACEGLICYMHNRGRHEFAWETLSKIDGGDGRVVALCEAFQAMERHFGGNPAHMHTKKSSH